MEYRRERGSTHGLVYVSTNHEQPTNYTPTYKTSTIQQNAPAAEPVVVAAAAVPQRACSAPWAPGGEDEGGKGRGWSTGRGRARFCQRSVREKNRGPKKKLQGYPLFTSGINKIARSNECT